MSMEIDPPHESNGSPNGTKEGETLIVSDNQSGYGLPYAPEDFPEPGDKWFWKVGKRVRVTGLYYVDRYLYLPERLHQKFKSSGHPYFTTRKGFASRSSVERFVMEKFPGTDMKAFFDSFTWRIPAAKSKDDTGNKQIIPERPVSVPKPQFNPAGCKAGNMKCWSLLKTNDPTNIMECDMCCIEPLFCRDCCCILCSRTVDTANGDHTVVKCEALIKEGFICGHICHIECGLRSYMAGTVGGTIGLDAEYYCRRCDAKTDLVPHVKKLLHSCESIPYGDQMQKTLNLCALILRGSAKPSAETLLSHVQYVLRKVKEGDFSEDIWKCEDASPVTICTFHTNTKGDPSETETDTMEVSNNKEPLQHDTASPRISFTNFNYQLESVELEKRIEKTLASLKKSQETEYNIAENILMTQKTHLLDLYKELDKEKAKLAKCSPSADPSLVHTVFKIMDQIKTEFEKITAMQAVGKGFGKTSKYVLKEHFGVQADA